VKKVSFDRGGCVRITVSSIRRIIRSR